jgi:two-component system, LytTR family, response regulator
MTTALIVDDEPLARDLLRSMLARLPDIEVVGEAGDGLAAVEAIERLRPELLFLDVQMPELDGFQVVRELDPERLPIIIFVTAYDQYALQAFEISALDYLLKPFDEERLVRAVERARAQLAGRERTDTDRRVLDLLQSVAQREQHLDRIVVRTEERAILLRTADIDWIEAASNYAQLHIGSRVYSLRETMNGLESKLDPDAFIRVHRSVIVRIDRIRELEPLVQGDYVVVLKDGTKITSSRSYRERMRDLLEYDRR